MDSLQPTPPPRGESLSRKLQPLLTTCLFTVKTSRFSSALLLIVACSLGFMLFSLKRTSPPVYPTAISIEKSHALRHNSALPKDSVLHRNDSGGILAAPGLSRKLPGALIIGARKAGTRALLEYLSVHPQVVVAHKEQHFFSSEENYARGMDWYLSQMPLSGPGEITMEKTPNYLVSDVTPARVHRMNSSVLLLLTLRHPVTRAISDYAQLRANRDAKDLYTGDFASKTIDLSTGKVIESYKPLWVSTYHLHVARWLQLFPRRQIHFVDGDRLITNPLGELRDLEKFLNLPRFFSEETVYFNATRGFYCRRVPVNGTLKDSCLGNTKGRKHPPVEQWVKTKLGQYFQEHNEKLFKMIGRRFDWT
ncbi:hypothetical protein EGW08_003484 [Elysia chlorotica]|uniref:Sulfotransferase domain-containing protein n=1 Tax=Elysia chlorotica TaxID=188477 RepID=A0A433U4K3_ELYCH|nr:hypothetical protein EGW08_003484 [Elysia chlorotica]